jgi:hypothetical protein
MFNQPHTYKRILAKEYPHCHAHDNLLSILSKSTWHMPARAGYQLEVEVHGVEKGHSKNG